MKTGMAAKRVGIHDNTVRLWVEEFKPFFGAGVAASPLSLSENDIRVLAYIKHLKDMGMTGDEVIAALKSIQQRHDGQLPEMDIFPEQADVAVVPVSTVEMAISEKTTIIGYLERHIQELKGDLNKRNDERDDLLKRLVAAETELSLIKQGWRPPGQG